MISVICPLYNHEKYVRQCLESILNQTYQDFEIIVIDDKSPDNSYMTAQSIKDERVRFYQNSHNMGVSCTLNKGIELAKGDILCFLATDDMMMPNHLEKVSDTFYQNKNLAAVFPSLTIINDYNTVIGQSPKIANSKYKILNKMFYSGNTLFAPGCCFKRNVFNEIGTFKNELIVTQDYDFNVRVLLQYSIEILEESSIYYRRFEAKTNLSADSSWSYKCDNIERNTVLNNYLAISSEEEYNKIFPNDKKDFTNFLEELPLALAEKAISSTNTMVQDWGLTLLLNIYKNNKNYDTLNMSKYISLYKKVITLNSYNMLSKREKIAKIKSFIKEILRVLLAKKSKEK